MKVLETTAIALAAISLLITIFFKLTGAPHFVTTTAIWRFTMCCLGFAIWARLPQPNRSPVARPEGDTEVAETTE